MFFKTTQQKLINILKRSPFVRDTIARRAIARKISLSFFTLHKHFNKMP